jgi:Raf kinase inhibitor-like YbhB/YbcL family protein
MRLAACPLLLGLAVVAPALAESPFALSSPDIRPGAKIADKFAFDRDCAGRNISPALSWHGAPAGTKGYVLTVYDQDAPTGSGFCHWMMYDIPASVTSLPEGAGTPGKQPGGAMMTPSDYGTEGYGGPCPPVGARPHRYIFTIYAVKTEKLDVPQNPTPAEVGQVTHFAMIGKASFTASYGR